MLARQSDEFDAVRRRAREVASHQLEQSHDAFPVCACASMVEGRIPRIRVTFERNGAFDVAQGPQGHREDRHRPDARIQKTEAKGQIVVAPGLKQSESLFEMFPRFAVLSSEPMRHSGRAVSDTGLGRIGSRLDVV